jgi:cation:H+ antiporter
MEAALEQFAHDLSGPLLGLLIVATLAVLAKSADWLVDEAVALSLRWRMPKAIIGATVVSLGTTTPEAAISVLAALGGSPGLALGNAVGSIICDTGLILGVGILIHPMHLERRIVNRQGWIQLGAGVLLVVAAFPFGSAATVFTDGGHLSQWVGWLFVILLLVYLAKSIQWSRNQGALPDAHVEGHPAASGGLLTLVRLAAAIGLVVGSSWVLIPAVREAAERMHVPEGIIAATLVAFGTSLPELVTVVAASWRGHGELGLGNVIGADILNVLFVAGVSAAVTPGGLTAEPHFFRLLFPAMLMVLLIFRAGVLFSGSEIRRPFGFLLVAAYVVAAGLSYLAR